MWLIGTYLLILKRKTVEICHKYIRILYDTHVHRVKKYVITLNDHNKFKVCEITDTH